MKAMIFSRILCLLALFFGSAFAQKFCLTPYSTYGQCVTYERCPLLLKVFDRYKTIPESYKQHFFDARCPGEGPLFCCDDLTEIPNFNKPILARADYESGLDPRGVSILSQLKCGPEDGKRIANGENAKPHKFPWMALLRYDTPDEPFKCGGSLISERYVLTAAHCIVGVPDKLIGVRLGEHDLRHDPDCITRNSRPRVRCSAPVLDMNIENIITHPDYSRAYKTNDAALLRLERNVEFRKEIAPICLPITIGSTLTDGRFSIAGWGKTESGTTSSILQYAQVGFLGQKECQKIYARTRITESHLCAGGDSISDSCKGDSGGPLFSLTSYNGLLRNVQFGIVSFGNIVCGKEQTYPGIYSNVVNLMPWITRTIANN